MKVVSSTYERHADSSGTITETYEDGSVRHTPLPSLWGNQISESFRRLGLSDVPGCRARPGTPTWRMTEDQITEADRDDNR
jgi:hypothetical protein